MTEDKRDGCLTIRTHEAENSANIVNDLSSPILEKPKNSSDLPAYVASRMSVEINRCWKYQGFHHRLGYARIYERPTRKFWQGHRFTYTCIIGAIPEGLELDHLCRNRWCCNPFHVEPVTHTENVRRGDRANHG